MGPDSKDPLVVHLVQKIFQWPCLKEADRLVVFLAS